MDKQTIIEILSSKLKLIRTEYNFSQEKMAEVLGLSKKTLVQVEKDRSKLSWTAAVALCTIFRESEILQMVLGENPIEIVEIIALNNLATPKNKTMGGYIWWDDIKISEKFKLQKNKISSHYRILDNENRRWYSSFDKEYIEEKFDVLNKN